MADARQSTESSTNARSQNHCRAYQFPLVERKLCAVSRRRLGLTKEKQAMRAFSFAAIELSLARSATGTRLPTSSALCPPAKGAATRGAQDTMRNGRRASSRGRTIQWISDPLSGATAADCSTRTPTVHDPAIGDCHVAAANHNWRQTPVPRGHLHVALVGLLTPELSKPGLLAVQLAVVGNPRKRAENHQQKRQWLEEEVCSSSLGYSGGAVPDSHRIPCSSAA